MKIKEMIATSGSKYALFSNDGKLTIQMPDGEGGWFIVQDDAFDMLEDFETHVDNLDEETRILFAEAADEFDF